jgi:acyl carrier protein
MSMNRDEKLVALAELMLVQMGEIDDNSILADIPGWDSVAAIRFVALVHEKFGVVIAGVVLEKAKTVGDLLKLMVRDS